MSHHRNYRSNKEDNLLPYSNRNTKMESTLSSSKIDNSLPIRDRPRFILLVILYLIQGIPIGLAFGSVPFLLKSGDLSYSQVGMFSLASYPYSLKLLWSPIVDSIYFKKIGRRRSWILPIQLVSGISLIILGNKIDKWMEVGQIINNLYKLTYAFLLLILFCATQDIAVDGWALTILSKNALSYASTAQTIGLNTGYFISFTVFLAFNSKDFANKYFRKIPLDHGLISLGQYMIYAGYLYLIITIILAFSVPEDPPFMRVNENIELHEWNENNNNNNNNNNKIKKTVDSLKDVYIKMFEVVRLKNVGTFILLHLICKIAFQANEGATNLKLLDKGFSREDLAITVLIDFPFEIIFGYYAARWSNGKEPLKPWLYGYVGRILAAILGQILIWSFPTNGKISKFYFAFVILQHLLSSFMSTVQFVSICAFHTLIADPSIGGTYMTTLNTLSNLGGQWPKIIALLLIDKFSKSHCLGKESRNPLINEPFYNCYDSNNKQQCLANGGDCIVIKDGYYTTNFLCILIGIVLYYGWIKKTVYHLQALPIGAWRINNHQLPI